MKFISPQKAEQVKSSFNVSVKLLKLLWKTEKALFIGNLVAVLIPAIIPFVTAYIFKLIIDLVVRAISIGTLDYHQLLVLLSVFFVSSYLQSLAFSYQDYVTKVLFTKFPITLYQIVLDKVSSLDMQYFEDSNFYDTLQKVKENYSWRPLQLISLNFFIIQSLVQVIIALFAIVRLNAFLLFLILFISLPDLYNQLFFSKFSWHIWNKRTPQRKKFAYLADLVQDYQSVKEMKIFGIRNKFLSEINTVLTDFFEENGSVIKKQLKINFGFNFFESLVSVGIAGYVILQAFLRRITIGDISFYQQVINSFSSGISGLFRNLSQIFDNSLYVESVFDVLEIEPIVKEVEKPIKINFRKTPKIEFKNVTFSYPRSKKKVFDNFSLVINPGEKIAFVGENGVGKTTFVKLLARFYDVDSGEILIDGINLKNLDLNSWYKSMGVLFQDFIRYEYPVKDNIFFGKIWEEENLNAVINAAKSAGADEMIKKFDQEYHQMLGRSFEQGIELSGGQWQKIALARAFFRNAPILILDEPTAAIDAKAESEIFGRVEKLSKDKTVIIISHRFSTVRNADKIYVISQGKISESGNHQTLMKLDGEYAKLFNLQAKGYK